MDGFERDLDRLASLGFCEDYRDRLRVEYSNDPDSVRTYVRTMVSVYGGSNVDSVQS